jgi:endonuclease/exonuclease/phosphatase family metal-dependent hydrolase
MASTTETKNINIYVVTYNCNDMKLTGNERSIENFVTRVIKITDAEKEKIDIYLNNRKTEVNSNEKNIFIFGIQEAPKNLNKPYTNMLKTITNNLNKDTTNYNYYYFDKTIISNTKLFIIYNDNNIKFDNEKFINLSKSVQNTFNKHTLRVTIKHDDQPILTVITTHLRKGNLAPFFINDLKKLLMDKNVYKDNIILFGDLNSRTLYKALGSHNFESYNDVKSSKITHIKETLQSLAGIPLLSLTDKDKHFINTLKHKNYYHSDSNIEFSNATNTLKNPTYRYDKTRDIPTLNYWKTKKNKKPMFKVPSYADRVLYKSDNKLTLIKDSAHVLNYVGSDHLPVIVKFNYEIDQSNTPPTIHVSLEKQQEAYKSQFNSNYKPKQLFNIL